MSKPVPRSRLNITYRTKIEGTPKKVKLPMRLLILGDFTGGNEEPLDERDVHSIHPGMELKSFMHELNVTAPIPKALQQSLKGTLKGHVTARFKKQPDKGAKTADLIFSGTGVVSGSRKDNGLGDFEGKVTISGKRDGVALNDKREPTGVTAATLTVSGKVRGDLEKGGVTGTVSGKFELTVVAGPAPTDLDLALDGDVAGEVPVNLTIPLFELNHTKPKAIAESVPETRRLVTLRRILLELRSYISGSPELRDAFKDVLENQTVQLVGLQQYLKTYYRQLLVESSPQPPIKAPSLPDSSRALLEMLISASGTAGSWQSLRALVSSSAPALTAKEAKDAATKAKADAEAAQKAAEAAQKEVDAKATASNASPPTATPEDVKKAQADAAEKARLAKDAKKAQDAAEKGADAAEKAEASKTKAEAAAVKAADVTAKEAASKATPPTATADQVEAARAEAKTAADAAKQAEETAKTAAKLVPPAERGNLEFHDQDEDFTETDRFVSSLAVFVANADLAEVDTIRTVMFEIDRLSERMDARVQDQIHQVLHSESFQRLERNWRSLQEIYKQVTSNEVIIDFIDVDKDTLAKDLQDHSAYILNSALFRKVYVEEYDRYGGRPFGTMIGLYEFDSSDEDIEWLETMSNISAAAHCPFIASVEPGFFGVKQWPELERKDDLETLLSMPQFGKWDAFRGTPHAAYIGLALPRFLLRKPYDADTGKSKFVNFVERVDDPEDADKDYYLWGSAAVLFARNLVHSFEASGWCQHIVGPVGGGMIQGLPVHEKLHHGHMEPQPPVEIAIPDYRELQFANTGFMALIHRKGTADATFFSTRSIKKAIEFEEKLSTQNADLVCNLAYTFSITRIAHYVKAMVRDYIGSTADGPYIQKMLETWLIDYVTTTINPDDLTLLYYPFKAMSVEVKEKPGPLGWYNCIVSVLPHIQFQGMDVELRLEAALGGAK